MENTTIEKLRILVKYRRSTDHYADIEFTTQDILDAMEEYHQYKLKNIGVIGDVIDCDGCYKTGRSYLGSTCPKCNRPFRSLKP